LKLFSEVLRKSISFLEFFIYMKQHSPI